MRKGELDCLLSNIYKFARAPRNSSIGSSYVYATAVAKRQDMHFIARQNIRPHLDEEWVRYARRDNICVHPYYDSTD